MAEVKFTLLGTEQRIHCADGQEQQWLDLAHALEKRCRDLKSKMGAVGDFKLLMTASLVMIDELNEAEESFKDLSEKLRLLLKG